MTASSPSMPRLLVVAQDQDLREILRRVLVEQGYGPSMAASLEQALRLVHRQPFDLILTELLSPSEQETLAFILPLRELAHPTPVVVIATWLRTRDVRASGFAARLRKPFDLNELMTTIAQCLNLPMSDEQRRQAEIVRRCAAALNQHDCQAVTALCTEEVHFYPWIVPPYPAARPVTGRATLQSYCQEWLYFLHDSHLRVTQICPCPHGIATRFFIGWLGADGVRQRQMAALCFRVAGEQISRVGVPPGDI